MSAAKRTYPVGARRLRSFDYADAAAVYFVTICIQERRAVFADPQLAQPVIDCLHWFRANRGVSIYALCLMPDHLHLLLCPGQDFGAIVRTFKTFPTRQVQLLGHDGKLWQDDYYDHILRRREDSFGIARYILENPVRRGLVTTPEAYRWSGLPDPM
jgi:REP element-mobilizing transposase RayT